MEPIRLTRADLPELYRVASAMAHTGQRRVVRLTMVLLCSGLASGVLALFGGRSGPSWHAWADTMAAALFATAAVGGALLSSGKAHRRWYDGRAAAESIKTLSWKYTMRAGSLGDDSAADALFCLRLTQVRAEIEQLGRADRRSLAPAAMLTPAMRRLRAAPLTVRRAVYLEQRIRDQIEWYSGKAGQAERRARAWQLLTAVIGTAGVCGALARSRGMVEVDALGLAAAFLASIAAWSELRQYWPNAAAYRLTLRELNVIEQQAGEVPDDPGEWRAFCEHAEYAVSREHTMWRVRAH
ncbi:DUF4231 domain-containing protein [Actinomadura fulvescens]|uniref:DUF4231 domain-containing protein n=1 Tax=Actinomadura fulvescens TaxID=46160 RepID=A0ABN3PLN2_9ACTN